MDHRGPRSPPNDRINRQFGAHVRARLREDPDALGFDDDDAEERGTDGGDNNNDDSAGLNDETKYVYLNLMPGENSWGLGDEYLKEVRGTDEEEEARQAQREREQAEDANVDQTFCPVCEMQMSPSHGPVCSELFLELMEYGKSENVAFAKHISKFYDVNIRRVLVTDPVLRNKPWHWKSVLNHCQHHQRNASAHFCIDYTAVISRLLTIAASNTVRVDEDTLRKATQECTNAADLNNRIMRSASINHGSVKELKELVTMRRQLMEQYRKSYDTERKTIQQMAQQKRAETNAIAQANSNARAATTHANQLDRYLQQTGV